MIDLTGAVKIKKQGFKLLFQHPILTNVRSLILSKTMVDDDSL